jgi:hypothetical protein
MRQQCGRIHVLVWWHNAEKDVCVDNFFVAVDFPLSLLEFRRIFIGLLPQRIQQWRGLCKKQGANVDMEQLHFFADNVPANYVRIVTREFLGHHSAEPDRFDRILHDNPSEEDEVNEEEVQMLNEEEVQMLNRKSRLLLCESWPLLSSTPDKVTFTHHRMSSVTQRYMRSHLLGSPLNNGSFFYHWPKDLLLHFLENLPPLDRSRLISVCESCRLVYLTRRTYWGEMAEMYIRFQWLRF